MQEIMIVHLDLEAKYKTKDGFNRMLSMFYGVENAVEYAFLNAYGLWARHNAQKTMERLRGK